MKGMFPRDIPVASLFVQMAMPLSLQGHLMSTLANANGDDKKESALPQEAPKVPTALTLLPPRPTRCVVAAGGGGAAKRRNGTPLRRPQQGCAALHTPETAAYETARLRIRTRADPMHPRRPALAAAWPLPLGSALWAPRRTGTR